MLNINYNICQLVDNLESIKIYYCDHEKYTELNDLSTCPQNRP